MGEQITLAVTAYDESARANFNWIRECIAPASTSDFVREIVIVNDSTPDYDALSEALAGNPKVKLFQNPSNLGVFGNKVQSVIHSTSAFVLMCDSDNLMDETFLSRLQSLEPWNANTLYSPTFAKPNFDYRGLAGEWNMETISKFVNRPLFACAINTGNQLVHRETFLEVLRPYGTYRFDLTLPDYFNAGNRADTRWRLIYDAADSFFINKCWMASGRTVSFVPGLEYQHRHHASSWSRAPDEKEVMTPIFILEMIDAKHGVKRNYRYAGRDGAVFKFNCEAGRVSLNISNMALGTW